MKLIAEFIGIEISTTAVSIGVRGRKGNEDFATVHMRGETLWHGQPAFEPGPLPEMIREALDKLRSRGWDFSKPGTLCFSVRQHDMVVVDRNNNPLMPMLSWQCQVAKDEVRVLREMGAEEVVGKIEARFVLAKLMWVLGQESWLRHMIYRVMMTGDFVTYALTGEESLSTSDALSNGLLDQGTKQPARPVIERAGLVSSWFPPVVQSGAFVGVVRRAPVKNGWEAVAEVLKGWRIVAGLGDNHANAVGAGLDDFSTIAISGGSSGTVTRICRPGTATEGKAASFEYFNNTLLLRMLADCAVSYNRFLDLHSLRGGSHWELNANALAANPNNLLFVDQRDTGEKREEVYPKGWDKLTVGEQVASMQASIAVLMLRLVEEQMDEVKTPPITRFVISGGMSQSEFLQGVLAMGLKWLAGPTCDVLVSARTGSLANKAAVLGAMFTAMAGTKGYPSLSDVVDKLCTLRLIQTYPVALEWFFVEFV